jgi:hypothetical protein
MTYIRSHLKEIGIVLSYLWMLVACYVFHWSPVGVFLSYLIETIVLLLVYAVLRTIDENRHPARYRKSQPLTTILIAVVPLALFQYFIIWIVTGYIDGGRATASESILFTREALYAVIACIVAYAIKAIQLTKNDQGLVVFQANFLFSALALTATNLVSLLIVCFTETGSLLVVLTGSVAMRIALEIWFDRKMKLI